MTSNPKGESNTIRIGTLIQLNPHKVADCSIKNLLENNPALVVDLVDGGVKCLVAFDDSTSEFWLPYSLVIPFEAIADAEDEEADCETL